MPYRTRWFALLSLALAWPLSAAPTKDTVCRKQTDAGQRKLDAGDNAGALKILEAVAEDCRTAQTKSGRPFLLLGTIYFRMKAVEKASTFFEEALRFEPTLSLARMNLGACQMIRGQFDGAIETTKQVLRESNNKHTLMQANFNIGLAYVKKAVAANRPVDPQAQNYFRQGTLLEPAFGGNYHYLGLITESVGHDFHTAKDFYREGCRKNYPPSCLMLANINNRAISGADSLPSAEPPATVAKPTASFHPLAPENEARLNFLAEAYAKKYDAKSATSVTSGLRESCRLVGDQQCRTMLEHTLTAVE